MSSSNFTGDSELVERRSTRLRPPFTPKLLLLLFLVLIIGIGVRFLTLQFMRMHLHDPAWFQTGSYAKFDKQARDILAGDQSLFFIPDASRTDLVQYPPAFPWLVALIYRLTGEQSAYTVQTVIWGLDTIVSLLLIAGIATSAFGWRAGIAACFLTGLSPLLAMYGAWPSTDAVTTWFVLAGNWALLLAAKRANLSLALVAGILLGVACWLRVNPLYLTFGWAFALAMLVKVGWRQRVKFGGFVLVGTTVVVAPIVIRNYLTFPDFTPTGGTIGVNLWEGLGETELGRSNGFAWADHVLAERERLRMGLPADFPIDIQWPDGIRRDRERTREALAFIKQRPLWYAGVMLTRMLGMLKVAGDPMPYYGSNGINVTSQKCLSAKWQGGLISVGVNLLGMFQSVVRYVFLPLVLLGVFLAIRSNPIVTGLLGVTILYYLIPGAAAHTELRYVMPMHGLLPVFGGLAVSWLLSRNQRQELLRARTNMKAL